MFAANPALVLNADFQPLSYFPLSLFNWEDAVKAVVKGSHVVVAEYDQVVRSPSTAMRLPSVIALRGVCSAAGSRRLHPVQRLPPRSLPLPVLRRPAPPRRTDVRSRPTARGRRSDVLDEHRGGLQSLATRGRTASTSSRCGSRSSRRSTTHGGPASVPAELSARDLARLSVLGRRAREVTAPAASFAAGVHRKIGVRGLELSVAPPFHSRRAISVKALRC